MASIFTKIIEGQLPSYKIHEDDLSISILALDQVTLGHTLVIPKLEVNHWFDVPEKDYLQVQLNAQKIAKAIKAATECPRILTTAIGFEVPHYHLHLIPAWSMADLNFSKAQRWAEADMQTIQKKIILHLNR